jgi:hypothetical protein
MGDLTWRVLTPEEAAERDAQVQRDLLNAAWQRWREHLCEESSGGHPWQLNSTAHLACAHGCGANPCHNLEDLIHMNPIPVKVTVHTERSYSYDYGAWEYDQWIEVTPHG